MSNRFFRLALTAAFASLASGAFAQGVAPSAESFLGRWRVVAGERAPWVKGSGFPMSLVNSGVIIGAELFSGMSPFGCVKPRYSVHPMPPQGLFQGTLPPDRAAATAKRLGFAEGPIHTLRIDCDNSTFDFHAVNGDMLKIAIDEVIYTFERRPVLDVSDSDFVPPPEPGFSCKKARTVAQRVTCTDEAAMLADKRMTDTLDRLMGELSKTGREGLASDQRSYLARVNRLCGTGAAMPEGPARKEAARCLAENLAARARFFGEMGAVGTRNRLTTEPRFAFRLRAVPGTGGEHVEMDATPFAVEGPVKAREGFNAQVQALLAPGLPLQDNPASAGSVERSYVLSLLGEKLLSLTVTRRSGSGTSAAAVTRVVNWNDEASRPLVLDDLFLPGSDWRSVFRPIAERLWSDPRARARFFSELEDVTRWSFEDERIRIWPSDDRPGEIRSDCAFCGVAVPAAALKPFLKPDSPWRP